MRAQAALVSCIYKNFCEMGHFASALHRLRPLRRFDWWFGLSPDHVSSTRSRECKWAAVLAAAASFACALPGVYCVLLSALLGGFALMGVWSFGTNATTPSSPTLEAAVTQTPPYAMQPPFSTTCVVYICEGDYIRALAVSLLSLLEHHNEAHGDLMVYVVDAGIDESDWHS